jgi:hypothetical protein
LNFSPALPRGFLTRTAHSKLTFGFDGKLQNFAFYFVARPKIDSPVSKSSAAMRDFFPSSIESRIKVGSRNRHDRGFIQIADVPRRQTVSPVSPSTAYSDRSVPSEQNTEIGRLIKPTRARQDALPRRCGGCI